MQRVHEFTPTKILPVSMILPLEALKLEKANEYNPYVPRMGRGGMGKSFVISLLSVESESVEMLSPALLHLLDLVGLVVVLLDDSHRGVHPPRDDVGGHATVPLPGD